MSTPQPQCPNGFGVQYRFLRSALLVTFALAASFWATQATSQTTEFWQFTSGNWTGGAYKDERGAFSHCYIAATYTSGTALAMGITANYDLRLVLGKPEWQFNIGESHPITLYVDRQYLGRFTATAQSRSMILIQIGDRADVFRWLQNGYALTLSAARQDFSFKLTGTKRALAKVKECVDLAVALSPNSNPFAPASTNPFASNKKSETGDDTAVVRALLVASGLKDVQMLRPGSSYKNASYAWRSGDITGGLWSVDMTGTDVDAMTQVLIGKVASNCNQGFGSQATETKTVGSSRIKQLYAGCVTKEGALYIGLTAVQVSDGAMFLINASTGDPNGVKKTNKNLGDVLTILLAE